MLLAGRFDGYWQWELNYWDIAAGIVILKEAGGFIDFIEPDAKNLIKKNIIATNSKYSSRTSDQFNEKKY